MYVLYYSVALLSFLYIWEPLPHNNSYGKTKENIPSFTAQTDGIAEIDNLHHH